MALKATISSGYRWRLGLIGGALLAFGLWFLYDGAVAYPAQQEIQLAYRDLQETTPPDEIAGPEGAWAKLAEERGWPLDTPGEPITDMSIMTQYICAAITLPIGLVFSVSFLRAGGRWVEASDEGLRTSKGQFARWDQVRHIDKSKWKSKGIALIKHDGEGADTILLDDWKFDRDATQAIMAELEARTGLGAAAPAPEPDAPNA